MSARLSASSAGVELDLDDTALPQPVQFTVQVDNMPASGYWYRVSYPQQKGFTVSVAERSADNGLDVEVRMWSRFEVPEGDSRLDVEVEICFDATCARQVAGGALRFSLGVQRARLARPEAGQPALPIADMRALDHDVVAAAYSPALDAVVIASARPQPALLVYPLATGDRQALALAQVPKALSLSPDGRQALLGHDAAVSLVELGATGPVLSKRWPASLDVVQVVLESPARAHVFASAHGGWATHATLDLATGQQIVRSALGLGIGNHRLLHGVVQGGLHPDGDRLYLADNGLSPSDLFRIDLDGPLAWQPVDSPYHGEHEPCGQLWFTRDAARLVTGCGVVYRASPDPALDMRYAGTLPIEGRSSSSLSAYRLSAFSDAVGAEPMAFIERPWGSCQPPRAPVLGCFDRLVLTEGPGFPAKARWSLAPVAVGQERWPQRAAALWRRADGRLVLVSEVRRTEDTSAWRLSLLPALP